MTFPLLSADCSGSLLFNLPLGCSRLSKPPLLAPIFFAIEALANWTGMCPGSPDELDCAFDAICKRSISTQDNLIRQSFLRFLKSQQKSANKPLALNLEEALGNLTSRELPPYKNFMQAVKICFQTTGLTGKSEEWTRILKRHYSAEMNAHTEELVDLCHHLLSNHINLQSAQGEKQHINQVKKSHKEQARLLNDVLNCPFKIRSQIVLEMPSFASDESRANYLQNTCNILLRENYLLKKIAQLFEHLRYELRSLDNRMIKNGQIADILRAIHKSNEENSANEFPSISFSLVANDLISKITLHQKHIPKFIKREDSLLNAINSQLFFSRFDRVFRYIDEVEQSHGRNKNNEDIAKIAIKIKNELKIFKCVSHCDNTIVYCLDMHMRVFKDLNCPPTDKEKSVSPLLTALFGFFKVNNNLEKGESDQFEMIDFFSKIITLYTDSQKKQGMIYKKAHASLCQLIDRQSPTTRRNFLKYKKIDIEMPGFEITLPQQLDPFSIESFHDPKSAMGKGDGEVKADAGLTDRQKTLLLQKTSAAPRKEKSPLADRPSSSRSVLKQRQAPLAPSRKDLTSLRDQTETLHLLDLPDAAPFPFVYDERVARWFTASVPLDQHLFSQYEHTTSHYQNKMIDLHAFSPLADYFCSRSYRYHPPKNFGRDTTCHILPAELTRGSSSERGYILWAIDRERCCYHRFFHIDESPNYYDKLVRRTFDVADFPELSRVQPQRPKKLVNLEQDPAGNSGNVDIELDELLRILTIRELEKDRCLKIFIGKSDSEEAESP